jgi:DNA excision repair protein ERCC-5
MLTYLSTYNVTITSLNYLFFANQSNRPSTSKGKSKAPSGTVILDENTVYLEDIDNSIPKTPSKRTSGPGEKSQDPSLISSKKKPRFHDHDPYRLPEVNLEEAVLAATRSTVPDPRLATEDELRAFIEDMRPEDFDVTSPAFRELPTEVQYEIVGDLRLKSRQTSYKRLQAMLQNAPTPLDFSRQQIKNLKQRNSLTQQLLMTTDSIGKAHLSIPVRIASERNKEYVLMKNEGDGGGWILGIRDDGTQDKPIEVDRDSDGEPGRDQGNDDDGGDSEMEMEEVDM